MKHHTRWPTLKSVHAWIPALLSIAVFFAPMAMIPTALARQRVMPTSETCETADPEVVPMVGDLGGRPDASATHLMRADPGMWDDERFTSRDEVVQAIAAQDRPAPAIREPFGTTKEIPLALRGNVYFLEPGTSRLPDFTKMKPVGTIYALRLDITPRPFDVGFPGITDRFEWFAIDYSGSFKIEKPGNYRFRLTSDDGARLLIDDKLVIDHDGIHAPSAAEGRILLQAGIHKIGVQYFQGPAAAIALVLEMAREGEDYRMFAPGSPGKVVKLLFVRPNRTSFEQIKELVYDQPFYVEAHFDVPPTENRKEVKLEWATGQTRAVVVTKTEKDPKVFRSEKITPKRPAASASETTPANTPSPRTNPNRTTPNPPNNSATTPSRSENPTPVYRVVGVEAPDQLTIRSGPGANNAEVGKIPSGASGVKSLGEETQVGTNTWVKVNYRGVVGWVNKTYLAAAQ